MSEHDEREWRLRRRRSDGPWTVDLQRHPSRDHERIVTVVPKARAQAAERERDQADRETDDLNRLRLAEEGRAIEAEQRVAELERGLEVCRLRLGVVKRERDQEHERYKSAQGRAESAEALLARARAQLDAILQVVPAVAGRLRVSARDELERTAAFSQREGDLLASLCEPTRAVLAEITTPGPPETVYIARCPEHGLHGCRQECFECRGPVEQVPMVEITTASKETT